MTENPPPPGPPAAAGQASGRVTAKDRFWRAASSDLAPDKSLTRMNDKAKQVLTSVTLVGTLLAGFGLIAPATLPLPPAARWLAAAAACAAVVAIALGMGSLLLHFNPDIRPNNTTEVENWYRLQFRRARLVVTAGWVLLLALTLAAAAALVTVTNPARPDPLILLQATTGAAGVIQVTARVEITGTHSGDTLRVELTAVRKGTRTLTARAVGQAAANGTASVTLTDPKFPPSAAAQVTVLLPGRRCIASLAVSPAPADADPGSVLCTEVE